MRLRNAMFTAAAAVALLAFAAPASHAQTASATVCADGTTSSSTEHDICVGHGGVKAKATSTVRQHVTCKDGTVTQEGKAVCADHGGVASTSSTTRTSTVTKKDGHVDDKLSEHAIALCKNGMYSHAEHRADACANSGGVDKFLVKP